MMKIMWMVVMGCPVSFLFAAAHAEPATRMILSVGQVEKAPSLPVEIVKMVQPAIQLVAAYQSRSDVFPSTTPLPQTLTELPDVVSALVGFWDSDIPSLCEKNFIEPIDAVFEELGLDPKEILPPDIYNAVTWQGKVWALPYRVETFVLKYQEDTFKRVGVEPAFESWDAMLAVAEKLSRAAFPGTQISGFSPVKMPDDQFGTFLISVAMDVPGDSAVNLSQLLSRYQERKVIVPDNFNWRDPVHDAGIRYILSRVLTVGRDVRIAPIPAALLPGMPQTIRPLGLMECFAVRKNTPEKTAAARNFLKTILSKEGQLALMQATALDKIQKDTLFRHVPVFRHVLDSAEFSEIAARTPAYKTLAECCTNARFAPANKSVTGPVLEAVLGRTKEVRAYIRSTGDRSSGFFKLAEPLEIQGTGKATSTPNTSRY